MRRVSWLTPITGRQGFPGESVTQGGGPTIIARQMSDVIDLTAFFALLSTHRTNRALRVKSACSASNTDAIPESRFAAATGGRHLRWAHDRSGLAAPNAEAQQEQKE